MNQPHTSFYRGADLLAALSEHRGSRDYDVSRRALHGKRRTSLSASDPGRSRKARRRARS